MRIGIDISQLAYPNTGVANYLKSLVENLVSVDTENEYVLFYSSMRKEFQISNLPAGRQVSNVKVKTYRLPPKILDLLWNKWHVLPIEMFVGNVDVFITSDWTEPPAQNAKKATVIYDMIVYKHPNETADIIREVQKRKLRWVKKESSLILTISESAKKDIIEILKIPEEKVKVIYPGI